MLAVLAAIGAGQSIFLSPNSASVLSKIDEEHLGATAGILATARNFGMVVGATLSTILFSYFSYDGPVSHGLLTLELLGDEQFVGALAMTFKCIAGLCFTGCVISTLRD